MIKSIPGETNSMAKQIVLKFWPVASLVLIAYIPVSFFILHDYVIGTIHSFNLLILVVSMPICIKKNKITLALNILPLLGLLTLLPWIITGGPANIGIWWSIVYVIGAFLVTPKKWAVFWLSLYLLSALLIVLLSNFGFYKVAYTNAELLNALFLYIITFMFVYLFNQVKEHYLELVDNKANELIETNKELSQAYKEIEQFAFVASHDLQEPLRTISNFVHLFEEKNKGKGDEDDERYLKYITNATTKMQVLIKDLLDFSRIGRNLKFTHVNLNKSIHEVIDSLDALIQERNAQVSIPKLPVLTANETELKLLFQNLISNAIKFQLEGNVPEIKVAVKENENEYLFSISDNGIGMESKYADKIFVIFQRLHSESEYPGTGIGLATCKKIVTLHNGRIWMESKLGKGSTFYFTISKKINKLNSTKH